MTGETDTLKHAIAQNDFEQVTALMSNNPALHRAPLGYANDGPLTLAAESAHRLAIVQWMIENGSDIHQGGDAPLMRAALSGTRIAMMELLVHHGADVNASWHGEYPILFAPCETVDPVALQWLLDHGAHPNPPGAPQTALDYVIGSYVRTPELATCIDLLIAAGGTTRFNEPSVLAILRGRSGELLEHLDAEPTLITKRFPKLDFGTTGGRMLTLRGATLLHVAAEYQNRAAAALLLRRGADVNARATIDDAGVGGQTALFHAVTQNDDQGLPVARLLIDKGADLSLRAKIPGHYERPGEVVECTPLGYAAQFQKSSALSSELGTPE